MNSDESDRHGPASRGIFLGASLLIAALGGAIVASRFSPADQRPSSPQPARPIVQIVRQQPGLPDLADLIDRLCPSVAIIIPEGSDTKANANASPGVPASAYSTDGWLVTSAAELPPMPIEALFGDGRTLELSVVRTDPVSGLAIVKATGATTPLSFNDQPFPRVGQFGVALKTPVGSGCSAQSSMIGSDFLADGGSPVGYIRLQSSLDGETAGMPLFGSDGRVVGIGAGNPVGAFIPAPIASVIIDELIRNGVSPTTAFGFRVIDYSAPFSARLGDVRSGAGVALVQPKSTAARAGTPSRRHRHCCR